MKLSRQGMLSRNALRTYSGTLSVWIWRAHRIDYPMAWAYLLSPLKIRRGSGVGSGLARLLSRVVVNVIEHIAHKVTGLVIVIVTVIVIGTTRNSGSSCGLCRAIPHSEGVNKETQRVRGQFVRA
jgi:hypothetical protein